MGVFEAGRKSASGTAFLICQEGETENMKGHRAKWNVITFARPPVKDRLSPEGAVDFRRKTYASPPGEKRYLRFRKGEDNESGNFLATGFYLYYDYEEKRKKSGRCFCIFRFLLVKIIKINT